MVEVHVDNYHILVVREGHADYHNRRVAFPFSACVYDAYIFQYVQPQDAWLAVSVVEFSS